jgi:hypothetical protein
VVKTRARLPGLLLIVPPAWYMLGPAGGFYRLVALAPGLNKFRAPIQGWFLVAFGLALLAAAGGNWLFARWRIPYLGIAGAAIFFADVWYWNSIDNPLAYARASFEELYGAHEEVGRAKVAASQPPLTRFDGPRYLAALGPQDHPLDLKLEATYGYFALEPAAYDEYTDALQRNSKLRDGLNVSRFLNMTTGSLDSNPSVLPRAYFPKAVVDVSSLAESRQALEKLDPAAQSVVLLPHSPIRQDAAATASVISYDEQSYRIRYHAASPSLLKLSVTWYPGWRATLAGGELPVVRVDHALMGAVVPAGDDEVEFRFHSNYLAAGLAITLVAALGLACWRGAPGRRSLRHRPRSAGSLAAGDLPRRDTGGKTAGATLSECSPECRGSQTPRGCEAPRWRRGTSHRRPARATRRLPAQCAGSSAIPRPRPAREPTRRCSVPEEASRHCAPQSTAAAWPPPR